MNFTLREYSLLGIALLAAVLFFTVYPSQDPRSAIELSADGYKVRKQAEKIMDKLGYGPEQFEASLTFGNNRQLLDTLQYRMGRAKLVQKMKNEENDNLHLFYWEVNFHLFTKYRPARGIEEAASVQTGPPDENREALQYRFDEEGHLRELVNAYPILPLQKVDRSALKAVFTEKKQRERAKKWMYALPDSTLGQKVRIAQMGMGNTSELFDSTFSEEKDTLDLLLSREDMFRMAAYYLEQTGWDQSVLQADTVVVERISGQEMATARYRSDQPGMMPPLTISVQMLPGGGLVALNANYQLGDEFNGGLVELWPVLRTAFIFLFCLAGIIMFFFRIRARAVDTKPALFIGILGGVAVSISILLASLPSINHLTNPNYLTGGVILMVVAGLSGAASSLAFFVFAAIGDSITRQYWTEKLSVNDYLRQGMLYNQPIGKMLIRAVLSAFVLAGVWTLALWAMPQLFIDIRHVFLHYKVLWPPLYLLMDNGWIALSIVLGIFLALGSQVYAMTKSRAVSFIMMVLAFAVVAPLTASYGPVFPEIILAAIIGSVLALIYLQWDAVTLFLSFFLFTGLVATAPGWIVAGAADYYIFISYLILIGILLMVGLWAVTRGREEQTLAPFVPDYVEELAQEERIKQELQIARDVQQSFLPVQTPEYEHLELAAMCKPAHETGGDYYDIIALDENRIAITIGDVSGKGIQAAFYMTFVKGVLHSLCREVESPAEVLKKANRLFYDNAQRGVFISLVYGILDLNKREFHFARAGHNPVLHFDKTNGQITELQPQGIGIGLDGGGYFDHSIEETSLKLDQKDLLILYTDGIVEALNPNHVFYGSHRLHNLLSKNEDRSAAEILHALSDDVHTYVGEAKQHDDMTMVILKMKENS